MILGCGFWGSLGTIQGFYSPGKARRLSSLLPAWLRSALVPWRVGQAADSITVVLAGAASAIAAAVGEQLGVEGGELGASGMVGAWTR
jgi:hypothetical protein